MKPERYVIGVMKKKIDVIMACCCVRSGVGPVDPR
jgi:hypothetical protein